MEEVVFHGSTRTIEDFHPFTHFGTREAAVHRVVGRHRFGNEEGPFYLHRVKLTFDSPLWVPDQGDNRYMGGLAIDAARELGYDLDYADEKILGEGGATERFQEWLDEEGYDMLQYRNRVEDPGSTSYANVYAEQVELLEVDELSTEHMGTPVGELLEQLSK